LRKKSIVIDKFEKLYTEVEQAHQSYLEAQYQKGEKAVRVMEFDNMIRALNMIRVLDCVSEHFKSKCKA
jgi:hypothetical protein